MQISEKDLLSEICIYRGRAELTLILSSHRRIACCEKFNDGFKWKCIDASIAIFCSVLIPNLFLS